MAATVRSRDTDISSGPSEVRIADGFSLALAEAEKFKGATAPNPAVGCALLDIQGRVLAVAAHHKAGQAHAEAAAIAQCRAQGLIDQVHTALVTLEPCSHHGRTPPCVDALLGTPVRDVWIGALDPHPRGPGAGVARLNAAGVRTHMMDELNHPDAPRLTRSAARLIAPFSTLVRLGRPWIVVKTARTVSGEMIPPPGQKTFTGPSSLILAHQLRKEADAVITGSGCILADDPAFTVRLVPDHPGKRRRLAILDRRRRVPETYLRAAEARGFAVAVYSDLDALPSALGAQGVLTALVEAGPTLRNAVIEAGLWDVEVVIRRNAAGDDEDAVEWIYRDEDLA